MAAAPISLVVGGIGIMGLDFVHPETRAKDAPRLRNVNLLLGDNGAGKTSVLRAVALALLGDALQFSGFRPYRLIRRIREWAPDVAFVKMLVVDDELDDAIPNSSPEVTVILERRGDNELVRATTPRAMGMRPAIAHSLVHLDIELTGLQVFGSFQEGVAFALGTAAR